MKAVFKNKHTVQFSDLTNGATFRINVYDHLYMKIPIVLHEVANTHFNTINLTTGHLHLCPNNLTVQPIIGTWTED